jgi:hypothetical protein
MTKPNAAVRLPIPARERPYAAFARHLVKQEEEEDVNPPQPIDPARRVTDDTLALLKHISDELAHAQMAATGLLPYAVRLKLTRTLLTVAEKAEAAHTLFSIWREHGTLTMPRVKTGRKRRFKPW